MHYCEHDYQQCLFPEQVHAKALWPCRSRHCTTTRRCPVNLRRGASHHYRGGESGQEKPLTITGEESQDWGALHHYYGGRGGESSQGEPLIITGEDGQVWRRTARRITIFLGVYF